MSLDRSRWNVQYMQRVLATDPIGYWMQDEKQGLVSYDMVTARSDGARNGAYTGPTLGQPGIGDGRTSAFYDAANDFDNIYSASLNAAFNGASATVMSWIRPTAAAWTDGVQRYSMHLFVDNNNRYIMTKEAANNTLSWQIISGGVFRGPTALVLPGTTRWLSTGMTVDEAADELIPYLDGVQATVTINGLGVWAGNLDPLRVLLGASNQAPVSPWDGGLAHGIIWGRVLSPAEMLSVGVL